MRSRRRHDEEQPAGLIEHPPRVLEGTDIVLDVLQYIDTDDGIEPLGHARAGKIVRHGPHARHPRREFPEAAFVDVRARDVIPASEEVHREVPNTRPHLEDPVAAKVRPELLIDPRVVPVRPGHQAKVHLFITATRGVHHISHVARMAYRSV
ncbi:MAG: hypothetical protein RDU83_09615 [bacterium]|nr:hypothetical protein [bacterium]